MKKKVMSLTYDDDKQLFSVGIVAVGEFAFGALIGEKYRVILGAIQFWNDESGEWKTYSVGEEFTMKQGHDFKLKADQVSSFICFYK